jgi:hypothetical protein
MQLEPQLPNPIYIDCTVDTIFLFSGKFNSILMADSVEHRRIPALVMSDTGRQLVGGGFFRYPAVAVLRHV